MMWKIGVILVCALWTSVEGNGYYGGSNGGGDTVPNFQQPQSSSVPVGSKAPLDAIPGTDPNWWLRTNAFQKPPNHPGLQRGDQMTAQPQPYSNYGRQPTFARGQNQVGSIPQSQIPSLPTDCMLRLKADCHNGGSGQSLNQGNGAQVSPTYQFDTLQAYPVYTAYVIPTGGPNAPQLPQRTYTPSNSEAVLYSSQQYSAFEANQPQQIPYQAQNAGSNRPSLPLEPIGQLPNIENEKSKEQPQRPLQQQSEQGQQGINIESKFYYKPSVVPYTASRVETPSNENTKLPQGSTSQKIPTLPNTGPGNNYENQPPYPGCPAAMLCVPESFCDAKGFSAGKPLPLSPAEKLYRVALMGCSAPITGEVGVCCRDPDYKDPWPMTNENNGENSQGLDSSQRDGKGIQYDDGQYHPGQRGQGNPTGHFVKHHGNGIPKNGAPSQPSTPSLGSPSRQPTQAQPFSTNYGSEQGSKTIMPTFYDIGPENDGRSPVTVDGNQKRHLIDPQFVGIGRNGSDGISSPLQKIQNDINQESQITTTSMAESTVPIDTVEEKIKKDVDTVKGKEIERMHENETMKIIYRPNPWSLEDEFLEPKIISIPSQYYQLPNLNIDGTKIFEIETKSNVTKNFEEITNNFSIRIGIPTRKSFVEECPNAMKCLRESYCQVPNPNEGSVDDFDVRLSPGKTTKLKCRQANLPVDGVCCFLREDYMSQVTTKPFSIGITSPPEQLANEVCGLRRIKTILSNTDTNETEFGEYPWQSLIFSGNKICSGAIITNRVIATAASCTHLMKRDEVRVRVGEWNQLTRSEKIAHQELKVGAIVQHPKFTPLTMDNNLALIYTQEPIKYDYHVGRICLPQPISTFEGKKCTLTGWSSAKRLLRGRIGTNEEYLHQADVKILTNFECEDRLKKTKLGSTFRLPNPTICAIPEQGRDICIGDEGSPLVCETINTGEYTLAGFLVGTNWGVNCNRPEVPGVFSNIPNLIEWMYNYVKKNPDDVISTNRKT